MELEVRHFFDAAHQLPDSEHLVTKACSNLHGHTYAVIVKASGTNEGGGMIVDFKAIKNVIDTLDHTTLLRKGNKYIALIHQDFLDKKQTKDVLVFDDEPTSENIAEYIKEEIFKQYPGLQNLMVSVCEGYKGIERANWTSTITSNFAYRQYEQKDIKETDLVL